MINNKILYILVCFISAIAVSEAGIRERHEGKEPLLSKIHQGEETVALIGGGLASRMIHYHEFETEAYLRNAGKKLIIRNMADEGNTPGFRPNANRNSPWAFPGAEKFYEGSELAAKSSAVGFFPNPDKWLEMVEADHVLAFFGFNAAYERGLEGIDTYKSELIAFVDHTLAQKYNGKTAPNLVLVSPTAIQDLSAKYSTPNGIKENEILGAYTQVIKEVAQAKGIKFIDLFSPTKELFASTKEEYTVDGALLLSNGYQFIAPILADAIFGKSKVDESKRAAVKAAVQEKNYYWVNDYKVPNGVHVYGRRYEPFGPDNYPYEIQKTREMTMIRDSAIWAALKGQTVDLTAADAKTLELPPVETNYTPNSEGRNGPDTTSKKMGQMGYLSGEEVEQTLVTPEGYKVELFASEEMFPELANPVQMSFDSKGRLWVAVMPNYPHHRVGDPKPQDKLLIFEDTDGDNKADKQTIFADDLHLPIGFEITPEGVYVSQGMNLVLLKDIDGDDKYDVKEVLLSGFDDHDTHHNIGAFTADPSGAIILCEGVFLHSDIETVYGPVRGTNGGFYRYAPQTRKLERYAQFNIPNPWGVAVDEWGQEIFLFSSNTSVGWMAPGTVLPRYGVNLKPGDLLADNKVRPTSGLEFLYSRHFPDEVQGDFILNNNIGYLGAKQHYLVDKGAGFEAKFRQDLFKTTYGNFRPVDLEVAPDGSLYFIDWSNILIGHMQHNARDPLRDKEHGRVYRITYPSRDLVKPATVAGASIENLLDNLKLPESRSRYRTRAELRGRDAAEVLPAITKWVASLDKSSERYEHHVLEALWVSWGLNATDKNLLEQLLQSSDFRVVSAAVQVLRYSTHLIDNHIELLTTASGHQHPRVQLMAAAAASRLTDKAQALNILDGMKSSDKLVDTTIKYGKAHIGNATAQFKKEVVKVPKFVKDKKLYLHGREIYNEGENCMQCHAPDGKGLAAAGFPPLAGSEWVTGNKTRLIKIILNGLIGEIEVNGKKYNGAMPGFASSLNDHDIAAVTYYIRNEWGHKDPTPVTKQEVTKVREMLKGNPQLMIADELLKQYPNK